MRKILFKAKIIEDDKWLKGYYIRHVKRTIYPFGDKVKPEDEQHAIMHDGFSDWGMPRDTVHFDIIPQTLCQYTGLADKNRKPIWENDILMCHGNPDDLVKVAYGEFDVVSIETEEIVDRAIGWHYEVVPTDALSKMEPFCYPMPLNQQNIKQCGMEVIGNMFDNPELLKGEENGCN